MGCGNSNMRNADPEMSRRNREIERVLDRDGRVQSDTIKLLLLGPGESGKSTIFKQMKLIAEDSEDGAFSMPQDVSLWRDVVHANCITQMQCLCQAVFDLKMDFADEANRKLADALLSLESTAWSADVAADIGRLWSDAGVQQTYGLRDSKFLLNDSAGYFFDNVARYGGADFAPTPNDVLRARVKTSGIEEAQFQFDDMKFLMVDVGGQRSERRKWIHCFDSVTAVIFCASLSGYDQVLREDTNQNRMKEALLLFDEVVNSVYFAHTSFILFLNKRDLFQDKIRRVPLTTCFPKYAGGHDYDAALEFIRERFIELNRDSRRIIYSHFTIAIDTENILVVWKAVRDTVLKNVLEEFF
jgi:GTPase SAR1 family protein